MSQRISLIQNHLIAPTKLLVLVIVLLLNNSVLGVQIKNDDKPLTVAIVLFDDVQIIDYSGPWEVFGQAGFTVFTVADKTESLTTRFGQKVTPDYDFEHSPNADIILLPGGRGTQRAADNPRAIKWIQEKAVNARYVMSVCTGAFLLARTGLLDGLTATTFHSVIPALATAAPKTKVVSDQRYVDNGKIITTAGLASGIDGALHLVEKVLGKGDAQFEALALEYNWQGDKTPARAMFADRYLPNIFQDLDGKFLSVEGDADHWDMQILVWKPTTVPAIIDLMRKKVPATPYAGTSVTVIERSGKVKDQSELAWRFKDEFGRSWAGYAAAKPTGTDKDKVELTVKLTRR